MGVEEMPIDKGLGTENKQSLSPVQDEKKEPGTNYIIAIGIDRYKKTSLPNLPNCVNDCKDLIKTLKTGFKKFEVYKELYDDQASRKAILDTIIAFYKDKSINNVCNNLVIYFSGHGGFVKTPSRKLGSWISYDFENDADEEFLRLDTLKTKLEFLETLHLLVIADCCFSASMFQNDVTFLTEDSQEPIGDLAELGFEPSRWGIASSRITQVSGAGEIGGNSVFTKELVAVLQQVTKAQVNFRDIATVLINKFRTDQVQRLRYKELNVSNDNSGEFTLYTKEEPLKAKLRYSYLANEFGSLNYTKQQNEFLNFNNNRALTFPCWTCLRNLVIMPTTCW